MLTKSQIKEFQKIWRKEYGEDISHDEALEKGIPLVRFVALINNIKTNHDD